MNNHADLAGSPKAVLVLSFLWHECNTSVITINWNEKFFYLGNLHPSNKVRNFVRYCDLQSLLGMKIYFNFTSNNEDFNLHTNDFTL